MQAFCSTFTALAAAGIYLLWRSFVPATRREQALHQRVAYMLWVMAEIVD